jgi:hypothetical protein
LGEVKINAKIPLVVIDHIESYYLNSDKELSQAIIRLVTNLEMVSTWSKILKKCELSCAKNHEVSAKQLMYVITDIIIECYRKRKSTQPKQSKSFENAKYLKQIKDSALKLSTLMNEYPHNYELYFNNPVLNQVNPVLLNLIHTVSSFKPEGSKRNTIFSDTRMPRKIHGLEGMQRQYVVELNNAFMKILKSPSFTEIAIIATVLFPDSNANLTAENIRSLVNN